MKSRVMMTEKESPNMMAVASGTQIGSLNRRGVIPSTVVKVVSKIGRKRLALAVTTASRTGRVGDCRRSLLIWSISRIELFTTIPVRAMKPIIDGKDSGLPTMAKP